MPQGRFGPKCCNDNLVGISRSFTYIVRQQNADSNEEYSKLSYDLMDTHPKAVRALSIVTEWLIEAAIS